MRPLDGITVVSVEQAVAAPFATRQLADLGARVIKIERPGEGDFARAYDGTVKGLASYFAWLNRSKESLTLDLKQQGAQDILRALVSQADVFIQNLAPGATARLGFGAEALRAERPSLIVCDVSGYGSDGPYRDKKAYDLLVQCEAGLVSVTGTPEEPAKVGISVADIAAGMYTYTAVLTALFARARTGVGASCEVSLFDALTEWMSHPMYYALYSGTPLPRTGTSHASIAPYGSFRTGGGRLVQLGIQNEREWRRFCDEVLLRPEIADDERVATNPVRVANRPALVAVIEDVFAEVDADEVVRRLDGAQIANARLNDVNDLIAHPQLAERDRWREVDSPVGPIRTLQPPVVTDGPEAVMGPIPAVGEHTDAILGELGYDGAAIAELHAAGTV
jgi:itaconate CoA-transferase